jgi:hypothetical protein
VNWEPTHGGVLAPALTDEEGRLQAHTGRAQGLRAAGAGRRVRV